MKDDGPRSLKLVDAWFGSLRAQLLGLMAVLGFVLTSSHLALRLSDFAETRVREATLSATVLAQSLAAAAFGAAEGWKTPRWGGVGEPPESSRQLLARLAREAKKSLDLIGLDLLDFEGRVVASTRPEREGSVIPRSRLSFQPRAIALADVSFTGPMEHEIPAVLHGPSGPEGYLLLSFRSDALARDLNRHVTTNLVLGLAWLAILGLAAVPLVRRVTRPVTELADAAIAIASGAPRPRLARAAIVEVAVLQERFIAMADAIQDKQRENQQLLAELERQVEAATAELQQANRFLGAVVTSLRDGLVTTDGDGALTTTTPRAIEILGEKDAMGRRLADLLPSPDRVRQALDGVLSGGARAASFQLGDPSTRYIEGDVTPLVGEDRRYGALVRLADVTERKRLEAQVQRAERLSAVGTIAATFAHELGNSLHVVLGLGKLLLPELPEGWRTREDLKSMVDETERAAALIQRFKLFATPSRGKTIDLELDSLAEDATRLLEPALRKAKVELELRTDPKTPLVHGDPVLIRQAILNVMMNAIQAMPEGGELVVALDRRPGDGDRREMARLSIQDTGVGIAPEHLPRIFDPFFSTKPESEGTGLGLSVVQTVMTLHGGTVEVDSQPGRGTTIWLSFPSAMSGTGGQ